MHFSNSYPSSDAMFPHNFVRPGDGSPSATNAVVVVSVFVVVVSTKAFLVHRRSSPSFTYT